MHKRWYDVDSTISLAVSLIRNAETPLQEKCADYIINYAQEKGLQLKNNTLNDTFNYILRRWYEQDEHIAQAFEYFENAPLDLQKEIALEVINILQFA
ncbi:MAG: hypothetical protein MJ229_03470 [bacterium]|nr:hypothetical protein [bacterium]